MTWKRCLKCSKEVFLERGETLCPDCGSEISTTKPPESPAVVMSSLVQQAEEQAKVIEGFGKVLQIIGYILIALDLIGIIFALFSSQWIALLVCLIGIPLTFVYFNVIGSAVRALGLYIQIRVR